MTSGGPHHDREAAAADRSTALADALARVKLSGAIFLHSEYTEAWAYESMASQDVAADSSYAPEIAMTVYLCWLAALASATADGEVAISVREADDALRFELAAEALGAEFDRLHDRVEALGGSLTMESGRLSGSLPLRK